MDLKRDKPTVLKKVFAGIKGALALFFALPFILLLLPLWYVYRWSEVRSGRREPKPPWDVIWSSQRKKSLSKPFFTLQKSSTSQENESSSQSQTRVSQISLPSRDGVALVTGGACRLGSLICRDLADMGYQVAVVYHQSKTEAESLVAQINKEGGKAEPFCVDLKNPQQIITLLNDVERVLGVPELVINNAGIFLPTNMDVVSWEEMALLWQVNVQGPMYLAMNAGIRMREKGGQIIQLCDIWGEKPLAGYAAYSVSKAGLIMATRTLAREMAPHVRVNGIAPGAVLSRDGVEKDLNFQRSLSRTPLASNSKPEVVLQSVRYLLTAHFVTGEILHVDGGRGLV